MNHKAICDHEAERAYRQRAYIMHELEDSHFDALNPDGHVFGLNGYCLDALDYIPGGGMEADTPGPVFYARGWEKRGRQIECVRGVSLSEIREREALAERLIGEILAEEKR